MENMSMEGQEEKSLLISIKREFGPPAHGPTQSHRQLDGTISDKTVTKYEVSVYITAHTCLVWDTNDM